MVPFIIMSAMERPKPKPRLDTSPHASRRDLSDDYLGPVLISAAFAVSVRRETKPVRAKLVELPTRHGSEYTVILVTSPGRMWGSGAKPPEGHFGLASTQAKVVGAEM